MTECVIFKLHKYLTHSPEKRHKELDKVHDIVVLGEGDLKKEKEWEMTVETEQNIKPKSGFWSIFCHFKLVCKREHCI